MTEYEKLCTPPAVLQELNGYRAKVSQLEADLAEALAHQYDHLGGPVKEGSRDHEKCVRCEHLRRMHCHPNPQSTAPAMPPPCSHPKCGCHAMVSQESEELVATIAADRDEWKRKAEEALKEYEVGRAEVLVLRKDLLELASKEKEECNCEDYADMQSERDYERARALKAESSAAEARKALKSLNPPPIGTELRLVGEQVRHALSSDSGRGWVSPETYGRLKEWAQKAVSKLDGCNCTAPDCPDRALLAEAEALGLTSP